MSNRLSAEVAELELLKIDHTPLSDFREKWENTPNPTSAPLSLFALCPSGNPGTSTYSQRVSGKRCCCCNDCGHSSRNKLSAEFAELELLRVNHIPLPDFREKWENTPRPTRAPLSLFALCPSGNPATSRYSERVSGKPCSCDDCGYRRGRNKLSAEVAELGLLEIDYTPLPDFREKWENTPNPTSAPLSLFALCPSGNPAISTYSSRVTAWHRCSCDDCGYRRGRNKLSAEVAELELLKIDHTPLSDFREKWENIPQPTRAPLSLFALCPSGNPATSTYGSRVNKESRCGCDDCGYKGGYRDNRSGGIYITDHGHIKVGKSQFSAISSRIKTHQHNFGKIKYWRVWIWEDGSIASKVEREILDFLRYWHLSIGHDLRKQHIRRGKKNGDTELFPRSIFTMPGALERHIERIIAKYPAPIHSYADIAI